MDQDDAPSSTCQSSNTTTTTNNNNSDNTTMNVDDSNNINVPNQTSCSKKRRRQEETEHNYKGIVHQQNGNWGAQIYAKHHRYWLGTFKSKEEAARAYESAALKLRPDNSGRNLDCTLLTLQEHDFQTQFTLEAILTMIKDGSYQPKFQEFLRVQREKVQPTLPGINLHPKLQGDKNFSYLPLFQKELTPSDVGKLNRLVIPKKYAVKYFPRVHDSDNVERGVVGDMELVVYDRLMKPWKFRYSYWTSSQSYVFTRGWNRFVRERFLKEKDIVSFYSCICNGGQLYLIDVIYTSDPKPEGVKELQLELELGPKVKNEMAAESEKGIGEKKVLRTKLFGVLIEKEICSSVIPS